jgi:hypothetical protein
MRPLDTVTVVAVRWPQALGGAVALAIFAVATAVASCTSTTAYGASTVASALIDDNNNNMVVERRPPTEEGV